MSDELQIGDVQNQRREYFRVSDVLPLVAKRIENLTGKKSRILSGYFAGLAAANFVGESADATINPKLWKLLCDINLKLDLILDRLSGNSEETTNAETREVSLSASGISFLTQDRFDLGDLIEVRVYLPIHPPVWVILYGHLVRISDANNGQQEVAVEFFDMDNEVRDVISYYTIRRQREIIMKKKRYNM